MGFEKNDSIFWRINDKADLSFTAFVEGGRGAKIKFA